MLSTNPFDDDKLKEECGIFGIWGADNAASFVALGLHALQHRGQEAAGVVSYDGQHFHAHKAMGHVAGNFDRDEIIRRLAGRSAIGHVRYSTTGESGMRNIQPLFAELAEGGFAVAHNGNISNAMQLRRTLNRRGSIFQSTSDTEVIIHLVATSSQENLLDRLTDALKLVEGAYSLVVLTEEGLIACRDPLGIRPLVMGKLGEATIFASETVAFDVIGASFLREVEPGELILVNDSGIRSSISRGRTPSPKASRSTKSARRSAPSWRSRRRSRRIMSCPCRTAEFPRRSVSPKRRESHSSWESSARTMWDEPSSSRARRFAISASS
jgi:amidophosphoribosyltransferase